MKHVTIIYTIPDQEGNWFLSKAEKTEENMEKALQCVTYLYEELREQLEGMIDNPELVIDKVIIV